MDESRRSGAGGITAKMILRRLGVEHLPVAVQQEEIRRWAASNYISPALQAELEAAGFSVEVRPATPEEVDDIGKVRELAAKARDRGVLLHLLTCSEAGVHLIASASRRLVVVGDAGAAVMDADQGPIDPFAVPLLLGVREHATAFVHQRIAVSDDRGEDEAAVAELVAAMGCRVVVRHHEFSPDELVQAALASPPPGRA